MEGHSYHTGGRSCNHVYASSTPTVRGTSAEGDAHSLAVLDSSRLGSKVPPSESWPDQLFHSLGARHYDPISRIARRGAFPCIPTVVECALYKKQMACFLHLHPHVRYEEQGTGQSRAYGMGTYHLNVRDGHCLHLAKQPLPAARSADRHLATSCFKSGGQRTSSQNASTRVSCDPVVQTRSMNLDDSTP